VQDDPEEQSADVNSEEELKDTKLRIHRLKKMMQDLEWWHQLSSDRAVGQQIVGEQHEWNRTAAPNVTENSQPHYFFSQYFQTSRYMQWDA
jgi:hypothetical protein